MQPRAKSPRSIATAMTRNTPSSLTATTLAHPKTNVPSAEARTMAGPLGPDGRLATPTGPGSPGKVGTVDPFAQASGQQVIRKLRLSATSGTLTHFTPTVFIDQESG